MPKVYAALKSAMAFSLLAVAGFVAAQQLVVSVQAPDGSAVPGVVVFAEPLDKPVPVSVQTPPLLVAQKDRAFAPYVSVVQSNHTVKFVNQDDITHHVYSAVGHNRFAFKLGAGKSQQIVAEVGQADPFEVVAMGCNIHDWMSGYMLVLNTPYFAQTSAQGQVTLSLVEAGTYRLSVWHPQLQTDDKLMRKQLIVQRDTTTRFSLTKPLAPLLQHASEDDFDFLEDY